MPTYWNLSTNTFTEISEEEASSVDYNKASTFDGRELYVSRSRDDFDLAAQQIHEFTRGKWDEYVKEHPDLGQILHAKKGKVQVVNTDEFFCGRDRKSVDYLLSKLRAAMVIDEMCYKQKRTDPDKRADIIFRCWGLGEELPNHAHSLSPKFVKTIDKKLKATTPKGALKYFDFDLTILEHLTKLDVIKVYLKAFAKDGAGFVVGRIVTKDQIIIARENVESAHGAEHAEIEILKKISESTLPAEDPIEIISSQANVINWVNGINNPKTHLVQRDSVMSWLKSSVGGFTSYKMSDQLSREFRTEKRR